jgi:hypothetical protein
MLTLRVAVEPVMLTFNMEFVTLTSRVATEPVMLTFRVT